MSDRAGNWMEGVSPEDRVADVAALTFQKCFQSVLHYLPLAADKANEDPEHIHLLRVWTRRSAAALRLYKGLLPRRRRRSIKKQLKRVRNAANDARDLDVLMQRLEKQSGQDTKSWLKDARMERREAQRTVRAAFQRLERGERFARRIDKLLARVGSGAEGSGAAAEACFRDWAREQLRPVVDRFFGAVPSDPNDEVGLHRFRIREKELRYSVELLAGAFSSAVQTEIYPMIEMIQDRLGRINDRATAKERLQQKIDATDDSADAALWRRLLESELRQFDQDCREFWEWCTPQLLQELRKGFQAVLAEPAPILRQV